MVGRLVDGSKATGRPPLGLHDYSQYHGGSGAAGIGYIGGAAIGCALAHRTTRRRCVSFQGDGDFMMVPARCGPQRITGFRSLMVIHNNRAWYKKTMSSKF